MNAKEFTPLLLLAQKATGTEPDKWDAHVQLISWFRSDPVAVIEALQAAAHVSERPGGLHHTRLHQAIRKIKP